MSNLKNLEVWFITGSQHLYGEETLKKVAGNAGALAAELNTLGLHSRKGRIQTGTDRSRIDYRIFAWKPMLHSHASV